MRMKTLVALVVVLVAACLFVGLQIPDNGIVIDGRELHGPLKVLAGGTAVFIVPVVMVCVFILLGIILSGTGLVVVGSLAVAALCVAAALLPLLLPVLVPVAVVLVVIRVAHSAGKRTGGDHTGVR